MNAKLVLAMACTAALAAMSAEQAAAQELAGSSALHPMSLGQGRAAGIQLIASSFGISPAAAASRMNVEEHAPDIVASIRTQYADRLAGLYLEHSPTHRIVVRLSGADAVPSEAYQFGDDQLEVVYQVGAAHTLADLQQRFNAGFVGLKQQVPALQSGYVDERTGDIVLEVVNDRPGLVGGREALASDRNAAASVMLAQQSLADDYFGVATRIVPMGRIENQAIKGSGDLAFVQASSNLLCTGAFTVKTTTTPITYGLLTAGHCQADTGSYGYTEAAGGSTTATLTHVARRFDSSTDVGWAMISTNASDALASFYTGSVTGWQTPAMPLGKAGTTVGASMCHYGTVSGSSCGTVASTAYNPGSICGPTVVPYGGSDACSATYIAVDSMTCAPSDSGGPVYTPTSYRPAGVHKAGNTASGRCVYSSTDDIFGTPLNLQFR